MDQAAVQAEAVCREVQAHRSLEPVYASLEDALREFEASGGSLDEVLPGGDDEALGFSRGKPDGSVFWQRYAEVLRSELCTQGAELNTVVTHGAATTGASLVTILIATLGLPLVAAPVVAPIAGALLALGVKAMCGGGDATANPRTAPPAPPAPSAGPDGR